MSALLNSALKSGGLIFARLNTNAPDHYSCGLPYDSDGALAVEGGAVSYHHMGLGFTANGRLSINGGAAPSYFGSGSAGYSDTARLCLVQAAASVYVHGVPYNDAARVSFTNIPP